MLRQLSADGRRRRNDHVPRRQADRGDPASNVFIVAKGVIIGPPKSNLILPGITYDVVTEIAHAERMPGCDCAT